MRALPCVRPPRAPPHPHTTASAPSASARPAARGGEPRRQRRAQARGEWRAAPSGASARTLPAARLPRAPPYPHITAAAPSASALPAAARGREPRGGQEGVQEGDAQGRAQDEGQVGHAEGRPLRRAGRGAGRGAIGRVDFEFKSWYCQSAPVVALPYRALAQRRRRRCEGCDVSLRPSRVRWHYSRAGMRSKIAVLFLAGKGLCLKLRPWSRHGRKCV